MSEGRDAAKPQYSEPSDLHSAEDPSTSDPMQDLEEYNDNASWSTVEYWEGVAESLVRVTTAGFCGSLIGLAKERQVASAALALPEEAEAASLKIITTTPASKSASLPRRPPMPLPSPRRAVVVQNSNLPLLWTARCMLLATILETSRSLSPTRHVWLWMLQEQPDILPQHIVDDERIRPAVFSLGDYTIGGAVAGLAGSIASRQRSLRSGLGTGLVLGLLAGTVQAAMDVASVYVKREQQRAATAAAENVAVPTPPK